MCLDVFPRLTFLMIIEISWKQRVMFASWWDSLKIQKPIHCLILSNCKSLSNIIFSLMRILMVSSCWMPLLYFYRIIHLMLSLTLVLLFPSSVLRLDNQNLSLFWLDHPPLSRLVHHPLFQLVHWMKTLWLLIDLMKWNEVRLFLVYPDGLPRKLNLLELMLDMPPMENKLEVKRNMLVFP
jgi:hypothetical protein